MTLPDVRTIFLVAALAGLAACGGGDGDSSSGTSTGGTAPPPASTPPRAALTASPQSGTAPLTVAVDGRSSTAGSGAISSYHWDFGNGTTANGSTASTLYNASGSYVVTLTVTSTDGLTSATTQNVSVANPAVPNLIGLSETEALAALASAQMTAGTIEAASTSAGGTAMVISQTLPAGRAVAAGTVVGFVATTDPGPAPPPIDLSFRDPSSVGARVPDNVPVEIGVTSTYELASGIAAMAGRQANLTYRPGSEFPSPCYFVTSCYVGTLSLAGVPVGPDRLRVRVSDIRGNYTDISIPVIHDNPPQLAIRSPADNTVAIPTLMVDVSCSDDVPGCRVETLGPAGGDPRPHLADGVGGVTASIDLTQWAGTTIDLLFRVFDSAQQVTEVHRNIYVESPARLSIAEPSHGGDIFATDGRKLLLVESLATGDRVSIYDRLSRTSEPVPLPDGNRVDARVAFLTPNGAIFTATPIGGNSLNIQLYLWGAGTLTDLGKPDGGTSLDAAGRFAIWNQGGSLYRIDTTTGVSGLVTSNAINTDNVVAADGTVIFHSNGSNLLYRDRAGVQTLLTPDTTVRHLNPRTDGNDVVYVQRQTSNSSQAIAFIDDTAPPILLTPFRSGTPSYAIEAGWVAFTDLGANNQSHVWTRAPDGTLLRRTDFASSSALEKLAPNGDVLITRNARRYLSRGAQLLEISSTSGKPYHLDGEWYLALGGTLLRVNDDP